MPLWDGPTSSASLGSLIKAQNKTGRKQAISVGEHSYENQLFDHIGNSSHKGTFDTADNGERIYNPAFFWNDVG